MTYYICPKAKTCENGLCNHKQPHSFNRLCIQDYVDCPACIEYIDEIIFIEEREFQVD